MNYAEVKKQKEQKLNDAQAKLLAKKRIIEDTLAKKTKLEKECLDKLGIPLSEVKAEKASLEQKLNKMMQELNDEVDNIEQKLSKLG